MRFKLLNGQKPTSLLAMLISLTLLFIIAQITLFILHYKVTDIIDSLVNTSISTGLFYPIVIGPIIGFLAMQILAYALFIAGIWFLSVSLGEFFRLSQRTTFWFGVVIWALACSGLLLLNHYYFPNSFFSKLINDAPFLKSGTPIILTFLFILLGIATAIAYINFFVFRRYRWLGSVFLVLGLSYSVFIFYDSKTEGVLVPPAYQSTSMPNVILIGLDSLRPDFTGYFGNQTIRTPSIDQFLTSAATFNQAYTPLARTFPAWISILTAKYPKHHYARNNLVDTERVLENDTIAKYLREKGYETIYATDEKRFSNITSGYGFDRVIGPSMGVNDFLLGGLSDFPLTNLLVSLPGAEYLFPYNYGNRASTITYEPNHFLNLVKKGLHRRTQKPVFLAIHLCLTHWPFTWANSKDDQFILPDQYKHSVEAIDSQFNQLLKILKENGLLENSWVVLLSDHGTALGMLGDRFISEKNYLGDRQQIKLVPVTRLSSAPEYGADKKDYTINTAYGQGTNVLSLKQYQVLLAFRRFGGQALLPARRIDATASLIDIAPTLLDLLSYSPMQHIDGISLRNELSGIYNDKPRPFFMETGDSLTEIETDHIYIEKVIKHQIGIYHINPATGLLMMDKQAEESILKNKQAAVLWDDWLLAHYPAHMQTKLDKSSAKNVVPQSYIVPSYFILANLKTQQWTIGLTSPFAKQAPLDELMNKLKDFFGNEV